MTKDEIIEGILGKEGGYVNNPKDRGGPTRWGVTESTARANGYTGDMKTLPRETAKKILEDDYWYSPRFNLIAEVSSRIADELCDTGVNMGPTVQVKFLQRWLNVFNKQGTLYPDLIADGAIGNRTVTALRAFLGSRGSQGEQVLLKALNCSQGSKYLDITENREANEEFIFGWMLNRVEL